MKEKIKQHFNGRYHTFYEKYLPKIKSLNGDEYMAKCPFHDDENPSFNFNSKTGQYYCHGCGKKGDFIHFYAKINSLDTRHDFGKVLRGIAKDFGIPWTEEPTRIIKTYDYVDEHGQLIHQTVRYEPKKFRQRQPSGKDSWKWDLKGIQPVLYRLPEIIKSSLVLIVEGEKDCDNLADLGLTATTCPMGAKKWRSEYSEHLRDKTVALLPDNDNEGREHMALVGAALNGIAKELFWIDLPGLPAKGDVSDWLAGFKDKAEAARQLTRIFDEAKPYEPPKKKTHEDAIIDLQGFINMDIPSKKIFLDPWLTDQSINLFSGFRGTGKTWLAMSIVSAISQGKPFGPWAGGEPVPCLYLDGEMPAKDTQDRLTALTANLENRNNLVIYSDHLANTLGLSKANLLSQTWRSIMYRILTTRGIKLWVADNLASLAGGIDENVKKDWDPINEWLLELRFAGISTILLHHTNKEGGQRGTSAREDNIDTSLLLKRPHDYVPEDGACFIVHFTKARVRTRDLDLISDTQFQLREDEDGQLIWTHGSVKRERKVEILKMLDDGQDYKTICEALDLSKGYISRIKTEAIKKGHLTANGKLTQPGFLALNE